MAVYLVAGCFLGWMVQLLFDHVFIRRPMKFSATRLRQLRNRLKGYEEETAILKEQVESANLALRNVTQDAESLNRQLGQVSANNAKLESSLNSLQIKYASKEVDLMHANEQVEDLHAKLREKPIITPDSTTQEVMAAYDEEHRLELEARSAELRAANAKIKSVQSELERVKIDLKTYQGDFSTTPEEYDAKLADMRDQIDAKSIALQVSNERIEALATSLETVRNSLKAKEAEIDGTPSDLKGLVDGLRLQVAKQNEALLSAETAQSELKQELESVRGRAAVLEAELQRRPNISSEQLNEMREMAEIREGESADATIRIGQLEAALQLANQEQEEVIQLQTALEQKEKEILARNAHIEELEAKLVLRTKEKYSQEKAYRAQVADGEAPKHTTDTLYYQISSLHADLMSMQQEMKSLQTKVVTREQDIARLTTQHGTTLGSRRGNSRSANSNNHVSAETKRDDLTVIHGVGTVYSKAFYEAGIYTFAQLSQLSDEKIISIIEPERWQSIDPAAWIEQAAALAAGTGA